jgi:hypothetical protein
MRSCESCHCFENCEKLKSFCREMVFRVRRIDITLIDNLAESCNYYVCAEAVRNIPEPVVEPWLFVAKG